PSGPGGSGGDDGASRRNGSARSGPAAGAPWFGGDTGGRVVENRPDGGGADGSGPASPADRAPSGGDRSRPGRRGTTEPARDGPTLEVLRHAVHDPGAVARWLGPELFDDPVQLGAYQALLAADTHADALASAEPPVADLLARLLVTEPESQALDAVRLLHMEVARREIAAVRLEAATDADGTRALTDLATLTRIIDGLRNGQTAAVSADRLLAWLADQDRDGG
ncbi:MAG TPA: hypothetical protein VF082_09625, partial [Jiangellaceae bacterium]